MAVLSIPHYVVGEYSHRRHYQHRPQLQRLRSLQRCAAVVTEPPMAAIAVDGGAAAAAAIAGAAMTSEPSLLSTWAEPTSGVAESPTVDGVAAADDAAVGARPTQHDARS